jgi:hypothetical protein
MRSSIAAVPLLASAFIGCAEPAPTSPPTVTSVQSLGVAAQRSSAARPFKGSCTTTFTAPPLPLPPVISQVDTGTCELTHLGRAALYGELEINFATGTQSGWRTLTAANGDELYLAVTGRNAGAVGGLVTIDAQLTIVGGTGRFAGATGSARGTGSANLATRSTSVSIEGTINY